MYKEILLAIDLNDASSWAKALPTAVQLASSFGAGLHVMTVVPDFGMSMVAQYFPAGYEQQALQDAQAKLDGMLQAELPAGVQAQRLVAHGTIYKEIVEAADRLQADLVVMASHRPELKDFLLGPNAARVVRHFPGSVMIVRG